MDRKTIAIIGTLDTKGREVKCLKEFIEERGCYTIIIDIGSGGKADIPADISAEEIAGAAGENIESLRKSTDRPRIAEIMIKGASLRLNNLPKKIDGIIAVGGLSSTNMAAGIMNSLPISVSKLIVSSAASMPGANRFFGPSGITLMHSLFDVGDLNSLLKAQLAQAAGAICGMVSAREIDFNTGKPMAAITTYGYTEHCVHSVCNALEPQFEMIRFHATGVPEISMEKLIEEGMFAGLIDVVPSSITNNVLKGSRTSWPQRMEATAKKGIPQVVSLGGVNTISRLGQTEETLKPELKGRRYYFMDPLRATVWLNSAELTALAAVYAKKLNMAKGPVKLVVPLKGWLSIEKPGSPYFDEAANLAFIKDIRTKLNPAIEVVEVDSNIDDEVFAQALVGAFKSVMGPG